MVLQAPRVRRRPVVPSRSLALYRPVWNLVDGAGLRMASCQLEGISILD
jgi:hypothetical protein